MKFIYRILFPFLLSFISDTYAQPIDHSIIFEILGDTSQGIKMKTNFLRFDKYRVVDLHEYKNYRSRRGFESVQNCSSCFKKDFPVPGQDYELISITNTETEKKMTILINMSRSNFSDAYLGITFIPGNYVLSFEEDYNWSKFSIQNKKELKYYMFKNERFLGLNITPIDWHDHAVSEIDRNLRYSNDRFKVYKSPAQPIEGIDLTGVYRENQDQDPKNVRLAFMSIGERIEITIRTDKEIVKPNQFQTEKEIIRSYQYISGSSLERLADSIYIFRGDSSWQFESKHKNFSDPSFLSPIEPIDEGTQILIDSCLNHNPYANNGLFSAKIAVVPYSISSYRPLVNLILETFEIISGKSGDKKTYHFADIDKFWWCKNLPIPVPVTDSVYISMAITDAINGLPINFLLEKGFKHTLSYGIADPRNKGKHRVPLYIKICKDGRLQLSYDYPKRGNEHSIMAVFEN